jgi:galactokinase
MWTDLYRETPMPATEFFKRYGPGPAFLSRAPGRVNLIGEHTDYNGGFVLPAAIDRSIRIAFRPAEDDRVELFSLDFNETASFALNALDRGFKPAWARYPMGVASVLQAEGFKLRGLRGVVKGDVPLGAGLSSSAAFEAASVLAYCGAAAVDLPGERLARICQRAENEFVGANCGIMDQFASLLGKRSCALLIDCETLAHQTYPFDERLARIVVMDTRVKRTLVGSDYNARRRECEAALAIIRRHVPEAKSYHDLSVSMFKAFAHDLPEPLLRRARHVVTENGRVQEAVKALRRGNMVTLGALMDASHDSLKEDFEVSCRELDIMVDLAREQTGVYGSRMTGAGFGGCTVTLVEPAHVEAFTRAVAAGYRARAGREAGVHVFTPSDGATLESLKP